MKIQNVIFYTLDKAIRSYRRMAQAAIDEAGIDITIDQWLVLQVLRAEDDLTQAEIAERVFKDQASVARILALLVKRELLSVAPLARDGRRLQLRITPKGHGVIAELLPIVHAYRAKALEGIAHADSELVHTVLNQIITNCTPQPPSDSWPDVSSSKKDSLPTVSR
jgi:DNA-binding MarR family transcriptional regulator